MTTEFNDFIQVGLASIQKDPIGYMQNILQESVRMDRGIVDLMKMDTTNKDRVNEWISDADGGVPDVEPWANYNKAELRGKAYYGEIVWDAFSYDIEYKVLDKQGKLEDEVAKMNTAMAEFYEAIRCYRVLSAIKSACNASTDVAASAVWTDNDAKIALDITNALQQLRNNHVKPDLLKKAKLIYPYAAEKWFYTSMNIGGEQQILADYIKRIIGTTEDPFIPYQPDIRNQGAYGSAEDKYDALGTSAILVVPGTELTPLGTHYTRVTKPGIPMMDITKNGLNGYTVSSFVGSIDMITPDYKLFGSTISGSTVYTSHAVEITGVVS